MTGRKRTTARARLRRAAARQVAAREEMATAASAAKVAGIPVAEIAELLGFKTRKAVYDLIERGR